MSPWPLLPLVQATPVQSGSEAVVLMVTSVVLSALVSATESTSILTEESHELRLPMVMSAGSRSQLPVVPRTAEVSTAADLLTLSTWPEVST